MRDEAREMYSNEEGTATKQSQLEYESRVLVLSSITFLLSGLALGVSLFQGELTREKLYPTDRGIILWCLLSLHSVTLSWETDPIRLYHAGLRGATLVILTITNDVYTEVSKNGRLSTNSPSRFRILIAIALVVTQILIPRTPRLSTADGTAVDSQNSSPAFQRYSMLWCREALHIASKSMQPEKLPALDHGTRSKTQPLITTPKTTLWNHVLAERYPSFAKQWVLMIVRSAVTFGSPYCIMQLLRCLERGHTATESPGIWLIGMGVFSTCETVIHYHQAWIQWSEMGIPIRAQLIMAIYQKALRIKDAKDPESVLPKNTSHTPEAVNLISSDSLTFTKFTAVHYILPLSFVKFFCAVIFLFNLLGWEGTLAALIITVASIPINTNVIKKERVAHKQLRIARDKRAKVVTEALHALRQIKFQASEIQWEERIKIFREEELLRLRDTFLAHNIRNIWKVASPLLVAAVSVFAYAFFRGKIAPSIIFPIIELLPHLQGTLGFLPVVFQDYFSARSTAHRMDSFLRKPEQKNILKPSSSGCITFTNASFSWPSSGERSETKAEESKGVSRRFTLNSVDAQFPVGELSIIHGDTGCGKSLLLAAIIGEVDLLQGIIEAPSATQGQPVALVSQTPWLQNATIKDNILFGSSMNHKRYESVLKACALLPDLAVLPKGDETLIGLRGVKLSGGQRARLSFARALYSETNTIVLDDIFSALDTHVSREIFEALTGTLCEGRTRILATHRVSLCLSRAKYLVRIENNTVKFADPVDGLQQTVIPLGPEQDIEPSSYTEERPAVITKDIKPKALKSVMTNASGSSDLNIYKSYFKAAGGFHFALIYILGLVTKQLLSAVPTWTLGRMNSIRKEPSIKSQGEIGLGAHIYLYLLGSVAATASEFVFNTYSMTGSIHASRSLFSQMTSKVIRMPLLWLDNTPIGEILRRSSADTQSVDEFVLATISEFANCLVKLVTIIGVGIYMSSYTGFLTMALLYSGAQVGKTYLKARKVVKRADANPNAQILDHFTTSVAGVSTIRAYGAADRFIEEMHTRIDKLSIVRRHFWMFNRWLGLQMSLLGILFSVGTGVVLLWSKSTIIDPSSTGFALTFSMGFSGALFKAVNSFGALETYMAATGEVTAYTELEPEDQSGVPVPEDWPSKGEIQVEDLEAGYSEELPVALKGVSFKATSGQRIGIVGRTGAGKSSLALSLLRLIESRSGAIKIDGIDISTIKLQDLRSRIAFVPQDPILFSGTVHSNLDYFQRYPTAKLKDALRRVRLLAENESKHTRFGAFNLDSPISAGGTNLSHGQRQLLCLARVMVQEPKIVILDEATSAVDDETDMWIQEMIRNEIGQTLIIVAHRLETIARFDKVIVVEEGRVREQGTPSELLEKKGAFWERVNSSEDREGLTEMILGRS